MAITINADDVVIIKNDNISAYEITSKIISLESAHGSYMLSNSQLTATSGEIRFNGVDVRNPQFQQYLEALNISYLNKNPNNHMTLKFNETLILTKHEIDWINSKIESNMLGSGVFSHNGITRIKAGESVKTSNSFIMGNEINIEADVKIKTKNSILRAKKGSIRFNGLEATQPDFKVFLQSKGVKFINLTIDNEIRSLIIIFPENAITLTHQEIENFKSLSLSTRAAPSRALNDLLSESLPHTPLVEEIMPVSSTVQNTESKTLQIIEKQDSDVALSIPSTVSYTPFVESILKPAPLCDALHARSPNDKNEEPTKKQLHLSIG